MSALEINNVSVTLNGKKILEDINLHLDEGEFLGIIGPNGAGKTTLLKVMIGLIPVDTGVVKVFGKPIEESKSKIGYVPQFNTFDSQYPISVDDVVKLGLLGKNRRENNGNKSSASLVSEVLKMVGMNDFAKTKIGRLSGGEIQRVLIARALVNLPSILMLDEPTASIDTNFGTSFYDLLRELNKQVTIVLVSHDIGAISSNVKKIACLNKNLVFHGSKNITREMLEATYHCPVDLIAHGVPHRVLDQHEH